MPDQVNIKTEIPLALSAAGLAQVGASGYPAAMLCATVGTFFLFLLPALLKTAVKPDSDQIDPDLLATCLAQVNQDLLDLRQEVNLNEDQFAVFKEQFAELTRAMGRMNSKTTLLRAIATRHSKELLDLKSDLKSLAGGLREMKEEFQKLGVRPETCEGLESFAGLEDKIKRFDLYKYLSGRPNLQADMGELCLYFHSETKIEKFKETAFSGNPTDQLRQLIERLYEYKLLGLLFKYLAENRPENYRELFGLDPR